jgi:hypothetical protein
MFDKHGRKRITLESLIKLEINGRRISTGRLAEESGEVKESIVDGHVIKYHFIDLRDISSKDSSLLPEEIPMEAVTIGHSSLLGKMISDEDIHPIRYLTVDSIDKCNNLHEIIDKKGILFLCMDTFNKVLLEPLAISQKVGTWTVGLVSNTSLRNLDNRFSGIDNLIVLNHSKVDQLNLWKMCKIIKTLWHACQHKGHICISAEDIEHFLTMGKIGFASVVEASGRNYLKLAIERAIFDFERSSNSSLSQIKIILLGVEVHPEARLYDEYRDVAESLLSVCHENTEMLQHLETNFRLKNAIVITLIGIPSCPPTVF